GIAAALRHVAEQDSWETHFRDTMVGGKMMNNPRMAQLHALEAPDRVRELELWGAVFDRTADGRILQRPFGGHTHPRLAHVGDRTGMVWRPGVRGLLVTEAVRGEGGILRNNLGERFMWKYLPEDRRHEYAESDEEARRWVEALTSGQSTDARRPPELSTRDNV